MAEQKNIEEKVIIPYDNGILKTEQELSIHKPTEDTPIKASIVEKVNEQKIEEIKKPSISGAIFSMTALSIGTGCLTFTKKVIQFGFVWFGVVLIIGGIATYWTLVGLVRVAKKEGDTEYSSTVRKILGKGAAILIDVMTALYSWGIIITYEVILNSLIGRVIYIFFKDKKTYETFSIYEEQKWDKLKIKLIVLVSLTILLFPLCLAKDIGKMRFFSLFGIISLSYTILVLLIECPFFWNYYLKNVYVKEDKSTHANWIDISRAFNSNLDFFTGFATIIFSFANHQGALPVERSLHTTDEKIMNKVFLISIILTLIIYFLTYISSFLTTPLQSEDLIIFRESIFNNDIFMNIAKIAIILELFFLIPGNYNSMRCCIFHLLFGNENVRTIPNIILSSLTLILSALIGAVYKEILNYISLLGGFCCTTICFLIPGWMMIKVEWQIMTKFNKILTVFGIVTLCILGYIGGIQSVILCFK
jgi:amino acid permease